MFNRIAETLNEAEAKLSQENHAFLKMVVDHKKSIDNTITPVNERRRKIEILKSLKDSLII
jgi:predicted transcriptional regulator